MTVMLIEEETDDVVFDVNFWHWRAIVEEIRRTKILKDETVDRLHQPFCGNGLNKDECKKISEYLKSIVIPELESDDRILLDGERTKEPWTGEFHREEPEKNYSTDKKVLLKFVEAIEQCNGFEVC